MSYSIPGNLIPTAARISVPPKAEMIATQTKAWFTSPIHGKTVILLDNPHNIGVNAINVITLLKSSAPNPSIIRANLRVSS